MAALPIQLDRARRIPLAAQIYWAIREGIENRRLASGARLPSWRDLAAQLGVSRGTVRCGLRASHRGAIRDRRCWRLRYVRANRVGKQGFKGDVPSQRAPVPSRYFAKRPPMLMRADARATGRSPASAETRDCPCWVKSGKAHGEHMLSALPPTTDIGQRGRQVRLVPTADVHQLASADTSIIGS
jgi:hypothetical protein